MSLSSVTLLQLFASYSTQVLEHTGYLLASHRLTFVRSEKISCFFKPVESLNFF